MPNAFLVKIFFQIPVTAFFLLKKENANHIIIISQCLGEEEMRMIQQICATMSKDLVLNNNIKAVGIISIGHIICQGRSTLVFKGANDTLGSCCEQIRHALL